MKKTFIILIFISIIPFIKCASQGFNNLWLSGYNCCSPMFGGTSVDFITGNFHATMNASTMNFTFTSANITDASGELLFYTNGWYVANSHHSHMLNGDDLNAGYFADVYGPMGFPVFQGAMILPFDEQNSNSYWIIHETFDTASSLFHPFSLNYSVVDMTLDNGLGAVVSKNIPIFQDTLVPGQISACRHANGRDWWIVVPKYHSNRYHIILATPFGLQHFTQDIGRVSGRQDWTGQTVFSNDGTRYARMDLHYGLFLMEFDRCSGTFSNFRAVDSSQFAGPASFGGVAFSPNNELVYVSHQQYLYQFDWNAPNLNLAKVLVATYDGFVDAGGTVFHHAQLAPDDKIYINMGGSGSTYLHTINSPDSSGLSCDVQQHSVRLPTWNNGSLSTPPNFRLHADGSTVCDSLITSTPSIISPANDFTLFPNPASDLFYLYGKCNEVAEIQLFSQTGELISVQQQKENQNCFKIEPLSKLNSGIYFLQVRMNNGILLNRKVCVWN
ncbi:MAG TPA: T9SS type A sorting domain-containing protein [Bacteroidia bacterium]|nr:T9SS type A sorting domain-containing protein [Bacteroidia bacterium]HNP98023.1 T9SS type A sorting domain-containing protein [Bacteroidia bacterium]